jgi:RNA polymerase sigma factor (sigma-70 family)
VQGKTVTSDPRDGLEDVWRRQGARLWRSLLAYTGDTEVASDAMAEAFAQALGRGADLRDTDRWVWKAAFRIAAGELQRRRKVAAGTPERTATYEMPEPIVDLVAALQRLSPNQRAAAILRVYADLPTREVARVMGCTQATVRVHLAQARWRLAPMLEERDD